MSSGGARGARKRGAESRKRARPAGKRGPSREADLDWEFASDDADSVGSGAGDSGAGRGAADASDKGDGVKETAEQKRIRLGKEYLARLADLERDADGDADSDAESDAGSAAGGVDGIEERIARRLQEDVQAQRGRSFRNVAPALRGAPLGPIRQHRGHKVRIARCQGPCLSTPPRAAVCGVRAPDAVSPVPQLPVTSLALQGDDARCFTGSKDCMVQAWDVETGKKLFRLPGRKWSRAERFANVPSDAPGHTDEVLAVAVSADGRMLASAGRDRLIRVWDARTARLTDTLTGHQKAVTALAFQRDTHTLFSSSYDRTVKMWNLDEMAYMETLLGHQRWGARISPPSADLAVLTHRAFPLSPSLQRDHGAGRHDPRARRVGGRRRDGACVEDPGGVAARVPRHRRLQHRRSLRGATAGRQRGSVHWRALTPLNPSRSYFRPQMNESYFASGGQDGALSMWHLGRKKPILTAQEAHGAGEAALRSMTPHPHPILTHGVPLLPSSLCVCGAGQWITSVAAMRGSDLLASGSSDGSVRFWHANVADRALQQVASAPLPGVINAMTFARSGRFLVAGVGQVRCREPPSVFGGQVAHAPRPRRNTVWAAGGGQRRARTGSRWCPSPTQCTRRAEGEQAPSLRGMGRPRAPLAPSASFHSAGEAGRTG